MSDTYAYRARDATGAEHTGTLPAASSSAAAREVAARGWTPVDIRLASPRQARAAVAAAAAGPGRAAPIGAATPLPARRVRRKATQLAFAMALRELAALLRAGVPLMKALQLAGDGAADLQVRAAVQRIARDLDVGHKLTSAAERESRFSGLLTPYDVALLQVGELTGRLPECFADLYRHREFVRNTNEQVAAALRYPIFVLLTCAVALVVVNILVLPNFAKVFAQARAPLPALTVALMGMSSLMVQGWWLLVAAGAVATVSWRRWLATAPGRLWWDRTKLRLPIVGPILQGIVLSRLAGALGTSISAGLTVTDALAVAGRTLDNAWFEGRLLLMREELARGASISAAARQMRVLPPTMLQLFAIGEESGSLSQLLSDIAVHYQSETDYAIKRLSTTIEPILIWLLGTGILVLALGVFMPMWDLGSATVR